MSFSATGTYREQLTELRWDDGEWSGDNASDVVENARGMVRARVRLHQGDWWVGRSDDGELGARAVADAILTDAVFDPPADVEPLPPGAVG